MNAVLGIISLLIDMIFFSANEYNIINTNDIFVINIRHLSFEILSTQTFFTHAKSSSDHKIKVCFI